MHFIFIFKGWIKAIDASLDGSVIIGNTRTAVIAHNTATGVVIWQNEMPDNACTLRIHGSVVVVLVDDSNTVVLDVTTGHQLHTLPPTGKYVIGICIFDGL